MSDLNRYSELDDFLCIDKDAVIEIFDISIRTLARQVKTGKFPKPIKVGNQNRWVLGDLRKFQARGGQ